MTGRPAGNAPALSARLAVRRARGAGLTINLAKRYTAQTFAERKRLRLSPFGQFRVQATLHTALGIPDRFSMTGKIKCQHEAMILQKWTERQRVPTSWDLLARDLVNDYNR
jgi:hypothetical protein